MGLWTPASGWVSFALALRSCAADAGRESGGTGMGFLTEAEEGSVRVTRMILHVVGRRDSEFSPEPEIPVQEELFFRSRIITEAASGVHSFEDHSLVKPILEQMAQSALTFEQGGQRLAQRFWIDHVKQSTSGAFFVFELRGDDPAVVLYAMVKYDYRSAVELSQVDGQSVLREIVQAFVKERKAVQKLCIARVRDGVAETIVSAADRMKEAPDLTDYFEKFLGVSRSRSARELSKQLNEVLRASLDELKDFLPNNDVGAAVAQAKVALQGRNTVSNDDVVDAILHAAGRPSDETVRLKLEKVARRKLRFKDLENVEFRPDPRTLRLQPRHVVRTAEDVKLEYPHEELGRAITREPTADGGWVFTVRTPRKLVEDNTLPHREPRGEPAAAVDKNERPLLTSPAAS